MLGRCPALLEYILYYTNIVIVLCENYNLRITTYEKDQNSKFVDLWKALNSLEWLHIIGKRQRHKRIKLA